MTAVAPQYDQAENHVDRTRRLALLLMAWQDVRVKGWAAKGAAPTAAPPGETAEELARRLEQRRASLLLHLDDDREPETGSVVELDAVRRANSAHPAFGELAVAMRRMRRSHPSGYRLLYRRLVGVCGAGRLVEVHVLAESRTADFGVRSALVSLDRLLPARFEFPRFVYDQELAWEQWVAAIRPQGTRRKGRTVAAELDRGAQTARVAYAKALAEAGVTQAQIGDRLGVSQSAVSQLLHGPAVDITESVTFEHTPREQRGYGCASISTAGMKRRAREMSGLSVEECAARERAWAEVARVRGW